MELTKEILEQLRIPFDANNIKIKMQTQPKDGDTGKALCVAYIDSRDVMERLDDVVEGAWTDFYSAGINGGVECRLTVCGVTRSDVGTADDNEKEKSAYSDAFKRAAVKFGIGRFLYDLPKMWAECTKKNGKYWNMNPGEMERMQADIQKYLGKQKPAPSQKQPAPVVVPLKPETVAAMQYAVKQVTEPEPASDLRYQPEQLRTYIQKLVVDYATYECNDKQKALCAATLDQCFDGDDADRHAIQYYLTGKQSMKEMTAPEIRALLKWLEPAKDAQGKYWPNGMSVREANAALSAAFIDAGQAPLI